MILALRIVTAIILLTNAITIVAGHDISAVGSVVNALFAGINITVLAFEFDRRNF